MTHNKATEANFDGLVGPTHNYAGLSWGNVASETNISSASNPRQAALQGLAKMKAMADWGFVQGVLPPHERPHIPTLRRLGYSGDDAAVLRQAQKDNPVILSAVSSASSMWTANAATVSPSADTDDGRVHFTPANLTAKFHRSIEHRVTGRMLQAIFADERHFAHHPALPGDHFGDEGAANHTRFCGDYGDPGVELFVYGREAFNEKAPAPKRYPARQTLEASRAVARLHGLSEERAVFAQQHPDAIDAGVFHNDVIAVGNGNVLFYHENAFLDEQSVLDELGRKLTGAELEAIKVPANRVSMMDAVASYLFNSQLLSNPAGGGMQLLVPGECRENTAVSDYLDELVAGSSQISKVDVFDLNQSMRNGGGPACLRLRVVLNAAEQKAVLPGVLMNDVLYRTLVDWVERHYRDQLTQKDLADPRLLEESRSALDELTRILGVGSIYDFQR